MKYITLFHQLSPHPFPPDISPILLARPRLLHSLLGLLDGLLAGGLGGGLRGDVFFDFFFEFFRKPKKRKGFPVSIFPPSVKKKEEN